VPKIQQTRVFHDWEQSLRDRHGKGLIASHIFRIANGLTGDVKYLGHKVFELRVHYGPGYRVYFMQQNAETIVLLNAGKKGSQRRDIAKAMRLAKTVEQA
jgi:putative addiction module killer protein